MFKKKLVRKNALAFSHLWAPARILFLTKAGERCFCKSLFLLSPTPPSKCRLFWMKRQECITPTLHRGSCVGAARKVSPNWSLETMTCHSSHCFSIVWGQGNAPLVTSLSSSCYMSPPRGVACVATALNLLQWRIQGGARDPLFSDSGSGWPASPPRAFPKVWIRHCSV